TYTKDGKATIDEPARRLLWPLKSFLLNRRALSGNQVDQGLEWWEYSQLNTRRFQAPIMIAFAEVATHNHFVLDRGGNVYKQTAPVIRLSEGATENDYLALLSLL